MQPQWRIDAALKARLKWTHCHERWADMAQLYDDGGWTMREIARRFNITPARVGQIIRKHKSRIDGRQGR